jgi:osmotically-inducible protein OsmY
MTPRISRLMARRAAGLAAALAVAALLGACAPVVVGGAMVGGGMMMVDRRTTGAQVEDQSIELKGNSMVSQLLGERGHVSLTSYNRVLLVTGEVPTEADRTAVEQALGRIENLRSTVNELAVMPSTSYSDRSNDALITSKVKATFVDASDLQANALKVVTERGTVYLMGRVTEREATRATALARSVGGVKKVVRVFEIISEAELAKLGTASTSAP